MEQVIKLDFGEPNLHVWILGKWCLVSYLNISMCEWDYIPFQKVDAKTKETLSKKYNLSKKDIDLISTSLKGKRKVEYIPTKDLRLKILYALNDVEPEKLLKREYWESGLLDCFIAEHTSNKKVLSKLCERTEESIHKVLKKREDYKEFSSKIKKPVPKKKPTQKRNKPNTQKPKKKTTPKKVTKKKQKTLDDLL